MKEIRLNDKMWFGKYKGVRIKDVADRDRMFLDKLLENPDIEFAENLKEYLGKRKSKYGEPFGYARAEQPRYNYYGANDLQEAGPEDRLENYDEANPSDEDVSPSDEVGNSYTLSRRTKRLIKNNTI